MVFNSVVFLFCFLPLALLAYYLVPGRGKNVVLLAESLLFYCWTGVEYLPLIVCLIVFNYLWGLLIGCCPLWLQSSTWRCWSILSMPIS